MSKISSASRIISKTMKNCKKKIHKERKWAIRLRKKEKRNRERPVWMNHLGFPHSLSPSHSVSLLQLNIYTVFHTACACQPVNIILLSARYIFQSSPDDRSCQIPSETQIRAIWKTLRHLFIEPPHWQVRKTSSLPPLNEGENDCVVYVWPRQPLNDNVCICLLCHDFTHCSGPYGIRKLGQSWRNGCEDFKSFEGTSFLDLSGKKVLRHTQKHRPDCLDLKPSDVKTLLWCLTLPQTLGHGVHTSQIVKSKGQSIQIYTIPSNRHLENCRNQRLALKSNDTEVGW